jgi:hypothetical protein
MEVFTNCGCVGTDTVRWKPVEASFSSTRRDDTARGVVVAAVVVAAVVVVVAAISNLDVELSGKLVLTGGNRGGDSIGLNCSAGEPFEIDPFVRRPDNEWRRENDLVLSCTATGLAAISRSGIGICW